MAQISKTSEVVFNQLTASISANLEDVGATIYYQISNDTNTITSFGSFIIDDEFYIAHAADKQYILNWVVEQLQITLI